MKPLHLIFLFMTFCFYLISFSEDVKEEWVARYIGPGTYDHASGVVADSNGNVYVAGDFDNGFNGDDYLLIKYDINGNKIWERRYNGSANDDDWIRSMIIDNEGYIYVTGRSINIYPDGAGGNGDCCTIKYDSDGNIVWKAIYDSPWHGFDDGFEIVLDEENNIYLSGMTIKNNNMNINEVYYLTVKYDRYGNELWETIFKGPGDSYPSALAVDRYGSVYVTGTSEIEWDNDDIYTIKYDTNGNELWVAHYNGPKDTDDLVGQIALDGEGNVYITGSSEVYMMDVDCITIKYDSNGNEEWVKRFGDDAYMTDNSGHGLVIDSEGFIYITGGYYYDNDHGSFLMKYDNDGNVVWLTKNQYKDYYYENPCGITKDEKDNIYIISWLNTSYTKSDDYSTTKYNKNGDKLWSIKYDGPAHSIDYENSIYVDQKGYVYVTGDSETDKITHFDIATVKYKQIGTDVELEYFNALPSKDRIILKWQVNSDDNETIEGFNIYRQEISSIEPEKINVDESPTKLLWKKINDNLITGSNPYQFSDINIVGGKTYKYRLEVVYKQDLSEISKTLGYTKAKAEDRPTSFSLTAVYPNPAINYINCKLSLPCNEQVELNIYDISGRLVLQNILNSVQKGEIETQIDISSLYSGVYNIVAVQSGSKSSSNIIIIK